MLTESQRLPNMLGQRLPNMLGQRLYNMLGQRVLNMLGQRLYNMLGQRLYNMLGQRLYNILGQHFLDEQSEDGFASRNQRWPNENCSLKPNVGPTSTCYLGHALFFCAPTFRHRATPLHPIKHITHLIDRKN